MLEKIVRINNPRNSGLAAVGEIERELLPVLVGKIGVEKRAGPSPSAFGNGNDNGVGAGKLASAAAEIPSHDTSNLFASGLRSSGVVVRGVCVITSPAVSPSVPQLVCCALPSI